MGSLFFPPTTLSFDSYQRDLEAGIDYFELLGVSEEAEAAEILSAFRARVRAVHPDTNRGAGDAGQVALLLRARSTLTGPEREGYLGLRRFHRLQQASRAAAATRAAAPPHPSAGVEGEEQNGVAWLEQVLRERRVREQALEELRRMGIKDGWQWEAAAGQAPAPAASVQRAYWTAEDAQSREYYAAEAASSREYYAAEAARSREYYAAEAARSRAFFEKEQAQTNQYFAGENARGRQFFEREQAPLRRQPPPRRTVASIEAERAKNNAASDEKRRRLDEYAQRMRQELDRQSAGYERFFRDVQRQIDEALRRR